MLRLLQIKKLIFVLLLVGAMSGCNQPNVSSHRIEDHVRSRIIVLTDMLNEPDDSQTMIRLLMYANRIDIEGLIAVSSCHQYAGKNDEDPVRNTVHPEEILIRIDAYEQVLENLKKHESGWPSGDYLRSKVGQGPAGYGMSAVGVGKSTSGSALITEAILSPDPRPLYICINAGANCLAQALFDLQQSVDTAKFQQITEKIRVYDDAGQDDAGAWIAHNFPRLHYQRSQSQVFSFMNDKGPVTWDSSYYPGEGQHIWANRNIQTQHGPLGALYPVRRKWKQPDFYNSIEGGGTSTWIGHVNHGLYVAEQMTWGGWGGRFKAEKEENVLALQLKWADLVETEEPFKPFHMYPEALDSWTDPITGIRYNETGTAIYRWRRAYQNDFEARMDWCVKPFEEANHNPIAAINADTSDGIVFFAALSGEEMSFDASKSSDPDGDSLSYRWYFYPEAGNYTGELSATSTSPVFSFRVPDDAANANIHLILEITDNNAIVPLYDYRRVVIQIN